MGIRLNKRNSVGEAKMPHFDPLYGTGQHFTGYCWEKNPSISRATNNKLTPQITESNTFFKAHFTSIAETIP